MDRQANDGSYHFSQLPDSQRQDHWGSTDHSGSRQENTGVEPGQGATGCPEAGGHAGWRNAGQAGNTGGAGHTWAPAGPAGPNPASPKKRAGLRVTAVLLACLVCGFGGGYAALAVFGGNNQTVVYRAPELTLTGVAEGQTPTVGDVAAFAGQSVVSVHTESTTAGYLTGLQTVSGAGSGVIISQDGIILTNHHVVQGANNIMVTLPDGSEHSARVVGSDAASDIAVLKIDVTGLVPAVLGNSDNLKVGDFCLAIGNSMGTLDGTVTDGIISGLNRELNIGDSLMSLIQTNAAVSPGNSGGGLFNNQGELVGIVNAKAAGQDAEGLGFAIPVNTAMQVAQHLIENGRVEGRPGLGITALAVTAEEAAQLGLPGAGVYITGVNRGGSAKAAGLAMNDRILEIEGEAIRSAGDISRILQDRAIGDTVTVTVERDGETHSVKVELKAV